MSCSMRCTSRLALALGLLMLAVAPALAGGMAAIETSAPLRDHSEESIATAFQSAIETALRGAAAMGLPAVHLLRAFVLDDRVSIQVLATPEGDRETEATPAPAPAPRDPSTGHARRIDL